MIIMEDKILLVVDRELKFEKGLTLGPNIVIQLETAKYRQKKKDRQWKAVYAISLLKKRKKSYLKQYKSVHFNSSGYISQRLIDYINKTLFN